MIRTIGWRLAAFAVTALAASILLFIAIKVVPGSAATAALGIDATPQAIARFEARHGLDRPWSVQYGEWLARAAQGDFGTSFQNGVPIGPDLAARLPVTLELALLAFLVANLIAVPLGVVAAARRRKAADRAAGAFATMVGATPSFWMATLLVLLVSLRLAWLPPSGFTPFLDDPWRNLQQMILPALSLGLVSAGLLTRMMRAAMLGVLHHDFIRTARAKGAGPQRVLYSHALRNALLPYLHVATVELGFLVGSVVVIEDIFRLPGLGSMVLTGIIGRDYPVLLAGALAITLFVFVANLVVDLVAIMIDPRPVHRKVA